MANLAVQVAKYDNMVESLKRKGVGMVYPFEVTNADTLNHNGNGLVQVACECLDTPRSTCS